MNLVQQLQEMSREAATDFIYSRMSIKALDAILSEVTKPYQDEDDEESNVDTDISAAPAVTPDEDETDGMNKTQLTDYASKVYFDHIKDAGNVYSNIPKHIRTKIEVASTKAKSMDYTPEELDAQQKSIAKSIISRGGKNSGRY